MSAQPETSSAASDGRSPARMAVGLLAAVTAVGLLVIWWPRLQEMVDRWSHDPRYSHGFLVPLFAAFLLWHRRAAMARITLGAHWGGAALIGLGLAVNFIGKYFFIEWIEAVALLPALAGLCVLVGGWPALRWSWPAIVFLFFMIPLPYRLENALGHPLQQLATRASTFALQTLGLPAVAEGNIILVNEARIGVVEACNGLGMLVMFTAFSVAVALLVDRPLLDRVLILLGAVPTAVVANIIRITVTGVLHTTVSGKVADTFYHDLAGWLMMPMALGLLWLEIVIISHLLIEPPAAASVSVPVVAWARPPRLGAGRPGPDQPAPPRA